MAYAEQTVNPYPNPLEAALSFAAHGLKVFPVSPLNKSPCEKGWLQSATSDQNKIKAMWARYPNAMVGVRTGAEADLIVIDLDLRDADGRNGLALFEEHFGSIWNHSPLIVKTPSGGRHLYVSHPGRDLYVCSGPLRGFHGIDVKSEKGYVITPGSTNAAGGQYTWDGDSGEEFEMFGVNSIRPVAPEILAHLNISTLAEREARLNAPAIDQDSDIDIAAATSYLRTAPEAIQGAQGNNTTFKVACRVKDLGVSAGMCLELLIEVYNWRCFPPWSREELYDIVQSAYRNGRDQPGCAAISQLVEDSKANGYHDDLEDENAPPSPVSRLKAEAWAEDEVDRSVSFEDWQNAPLDEDNFYREPAPDSGLADVGTKIGRLTGWGPDRSHDILKVNYLVKGLFDRKSVTVLYGPPSSGKTFVTVDLAHALASKKRTDWHGHKVYRLGKNRDISPGVVVYFAAEGGAGIRNRINAVCDKYGENWGSLPLRVFTGPIDLVSGASDEDIYNAIRHTGIKFASEKEKAKAAAEGREVRPARPVMIVFDTLAQCMAGQDENSSAAMSAAIQKLNQLADATGATVLALHHPGKSADKGARGHSGLLGNIDAMFELESDYAGTTGRVKGSGDDDWGGITLKAHKARDHEVPQPIRLQLTRVVVDVDEEGDRVTSCVVGPKTEDQPQVKEPLPGVFEDAVNRAAFDAMDQDAKTVVMSFMLSAVSQNWAKPLPADVREIYMGAGTWRKPMPAKKKDPSTFPVEYQIPKEALETAGDISRTARLLAIGWLAHGTKGYRLGESLLKPRPENSQN